MDIMHIVDLDKGKLAERRGRKTTGLRDAVLRQRGYRSDERPQAQKQERRPDLASNLRVGGNAKQQRSD